MVLFLSKDGNILKIRKYFSLLVYKVIEYSGYNIIEILDNKNNIKIYR